MLHTSFQKFQGLSRINESSTEEIFEVEIKGKDGKPQSDLVWARSAEEAMAKYRSDKKQSGERISDSISISVNTLSYEQIQKMKDNFESAKEQNKKKIGDLIKSYRSLRDDLASNLASINKLRPESERMDVDGELQKIDKLFRVVAKENTDDAEEQGEERAERAIRSQSKQADSAAENV